MSRLLILILIFLGGCATRNITENSEISEGHYIFITKVKSNLPRAELFMVRDEENKTVSKIGKQGGLMGYAIHTSPTPKIIVNRYTRTQQGLFWHAIEQMIEHDIPKVTVTLKPGVINYLGDLTYSTKDPATSSNPIVKITDNQKRARYFIKNTSGSLLEKYSFEVNLWSH